MQKSWFFICMIESSWKVVTNIFYFTLNALFVLTYSTSDNVTPPITRVLIARHLIFDSLTSPTCCNSPRKCTPYNIRKGKKLGFQLSHRQLLFDNVLGKNKDGRNHTITIISENSLSCQVSNAKHYWWPKKIKIPGIAEGKNPTQYFKSK